MIHEILVDQVDIANREVQRELDRAEAAIRFAASQIPIGEPGECEECGRELSRLVGGFCGRCRDQLGLS